MYPETIDWGPLPDVQFQFPEASSPLLGRIVHRVLQVFCRRYLSMTVSGLENLPQSGPFVIAANHCSHLDAVAVLSALDVREASRLRILGASDYFFNRRFKGWFFRNIMNVVPFDRTESSLNGLRVARLCVEQGCILLMFPEGTRSASGSIQKFKTGLGIVARDLRVPIVPARIDGTYEALPKGRFVPRPCTVTLSFGLPVIWEELEDDSCDSPITHCRSIVNCVRDQIVRLGVRSRVGTY